MTSSGIEFTVGLNDKFSEYITDSVELLNAQLGRHGMAFFFDTVDATQQVISGKHGEDMFGWAVPDELVDEFKPAWIDGDGVELEKYDYVCASWEDRNGQPYAAIDGNLPEEAYA